MELDQLAEHAFGPLDLRGGTLQADLVAARRDLDAEDLLDRAQVLVVGTEQGREILGLDDDPPCERTIDGRVLDESLLGGVSAKPFTYMDLA
jgi:hypothetical protein